MDLPSIARISTTWVGDILPNSERRETETVLGMLNASDTDQNADLFDFNDHAYRRFVQTIKVF